MPTHTSFVLTVIGPDRRGLVESLAETITAHEGNWVESRMASLAGQFAGLLWITVPTEHAHALQQALLALERGGLRLTVQPAEHATPVPARTLRLQVIGHDRPGIVRDLARALRQRHINVEELTSESYSAPMSGEPLFKADLELGIPADADMDELHQAMDHLAETLSLDLTYKQDAAEPQRRRRTNPKRTCTAISPARYHGGVSRLTSIETFTSPNRRIALCRVRTDDGAEGIGQLAPFHADIAATVLHRQVAPHALDRDVDELEQILLTITDREAKFLGTYLYRAMAGLDTAVWDLRARRAGVSVCELLGGAPRPLAVYGSSMQRDTTPDEEVRALADARERHGYRAFKLKIGKRRGHDDDQWPGRTETLIAEARRVLGDDVELMVDANSCYSPAKAIEVGRLLEAHRYAWFEEPCPHPELEQTAAVAATLDMPVAGGEQDNDLAQFRRMIAMDAVDVVQLDIGYVGGLSRAIEVVRMAQAAAKPWVPHTSNDSLILVFSLHLVAAMTGAAPFVEYNVRNTQTAGELYAPVVTVHDGQVHLLCESGEPGWGVRICPDWLSRADRSVSEATGRRADPA